MDFKWNNHIFGIFTMCTVLLLVERQAGMACQMNEKSLEMHSTGRIECKHNFTPDSFYLVKWTKSSSGQCFVNGLQALATQSGDRKVLFDPHYDIDTDQSLLINNVGLEDTGIYRCTVFQDDNTANFNSDTRLSVYKQPDDPPVLIHHIEGDEVIFNCSVGPVFPLNFPEFPFPHQNNHTILIKDGTYLASISAAFQYEGGEIEVKCSYSYQNEYWLTMYRDNRDVHEMTTESGPPNSSHSTVDYVVAYATLTLLVILFIPIVAVAIKIINPFSRKEPLHWLTAKLGIGHHNHDDMIQANYAREDDPEIVEMDEMELMQLENSSQENNSEQGEMDEMELMQLENSPEEHNSEQGEMDKMRLTKMLTINEKGHNPELERFATILIKMMEKLKQEDNPKQEKIVAKHEEENDPKKGEIAAKHEEENDPKQEKTGLT